MLISKVKGKIKGFGTKVADFFRKYGIDAVLALIIFNFPMYAIAFIKNETFVTFGKWWAALWWGLGPLTPGWLFTIFLAVFIRWFRFKIWKLILFLKETADKLQIQNQLMAYLSSEEIKMILDMAKLVEAESEVKRKIFKEALRKERLKMLDDQWTRERKQK